MSLAIEVSNFSTSALVRVGMCSYCSLGVSGIVGGMMRIGGWCSGMGMGIAIGGDG